MPRSDGFFSEWFLFGAGTGAKFRKPSVRSPRGAAARQPVQRSAAAKQQHVLQEEDRHEDGKQEE